MKTLLLFITFFTQLVAFPSFATLMKFSFVGEVTQIENQTTQVWDPNDLVGSEITGYFIMDVELASHGREETSFFWWHNIDYGPGALESSINIGNQTYFVTGDHDYDSVNQGYRTDEFLTYYSGIVRPGQPADDSISLSDNEQIETQVTEGDLYFNQKLSINFSDSINDFLKDFRPWTGSSEPQPDWLQEFIWSNDGDPNNGKFGSGEFEYNQALYRTGVGRESHFDSVLKFNLSRVTSERVLPVSSPSTMWLFYALFFAWYLQKRTKRYQTRLQLGG